MASSCEIKNTIEAAPMHVTLKRSARLAAKAQINNNQVCKANAMEAAHSKAMPKAMPKASKEAEKKPAPSTTFIEALSRQFTLSELVQSLTDRLKGNPEDGALPIFHVEFGGITRTTTISIENDKVVIE